MVDKEEINRVEKRIQEAFPDSEFHILLDIDGDAEVWNGDEATGIKWASMNPEDISVITRENAQIILEDLILGEMEKYIDNTSKERQNGED